MRRALFWAVKTWRQLTSPRVTDFRLFWPKKAQTANVGVLVCSAASPLPLLDQIPDEARKQAEELRLKFESGEHFLALSRKVPSGAEYRLEVQEQYAGQTVIHLVIVAPCRPDRPLEPLRRTGADVPG